MLCRALLTAVAISCTFSREVIGQGSQRKVQIKDLICVLWLSGMQKEDLDVNMLRKLQRHNVNIDDMSRETLKQQCLNFKLDKDNTTKEDENKKDDNENKTTTESVKLDDEHVKKLLKSDLKMILNNLMDTKSIKIINDKTQKLVNVPEIKSNKDTNIDILYSSLEGDKSLKFKAKSDYDQPKLASIIQFWQTFTTTSPYNYKDDKSNSNDPIPDEEMREHNNIKTNKKEQPKETEYINKLLADFISKNKKLTTETPTTTPVDLKKLSDQIEKLLHLYPQSKTHNSSSNIPKSKFEIVQDIKSNGNYFVNNGIPEKTAILNKRINQYDSYEKSIKNNNMKENNNRLLSIDFPTNAADLPVRVPVQVLGIKQREVVQSYQSIPGNNVNLELTNITSINVTKKDGVNIITQDYIKEIAENVKAIVLQDLRLEITSTPVSTSVATTTFISTTTPNQNNSSTAQASKEVTRENQTQNKSQEASQVITKFMEFFEQFKSMKEKTEIQSNSKQVVTNATHREIDGPFNVNHDARTVVIDPYRVKKPPENMPGNYSPFGVQSPSMVQTFPIHNANLVQINPMPLSTQSFYRLQQKPITIQTNSEEIRPLGIPLSKPLQLIHQNIVVTTTHPLVTQRYHRDKWVDQYEHKDTINRKETYKHYSISPRHAQYQHTAKPLDQKPYKDGRSGELENLLKEKEKHLFNQNLYKDDRLSKFKHLIKDTKAMDQSPYLNARLREFKSSFEKDETRLGQKSYKDYRHPEFKYDKLLDHIPYKEKRIREFNAKPSYQRPYESSRYSHRDRDSFTSPHDDVISFNLNKNNKVYGVEQKHFDNVSYGLLSRDRNSERFHEKLERVDDWRSDSRGYNEDNKDKLDVSSRQQQPLNMKESRFDDTHFKNFLKTQQKVNDMLEKILSSKTSRNGPLSVETT